MGNAMASTERRVGFTGIVRGEGQEAECVGSVTEVSLSGMPPQYVRYRIDSCSKSLPDGDYMVFAHGGNFAARHVAGNWLGRP
jgi:hypothetical protein